MAATSHEVILGLVCLCLLQRQIETKPTSWIGLSNQLSVLCSFKAPRYLRLPSSQKRDCPQTGPQVPDSAVPCDWLLDIGIWLKMYCKKAIHVSKQSVRSARTGKCSYTIHYMNYELNPLHFDQNKFLLPKSMERGVLWPQAIASPGTSRLAPLLDLHGTGTRELTLLYFLRLACLFQKI